MTGAARNEDALKQIHEIAGADSADMAIFMVAPLIDWARYPYKGLHSSLAAFCKENQIHFIDPLDDLSKHDAADLWLSPNDAHYGAEGDRIAAGVLYRFFKGK
jgi:hypothetical protein